MPSAKDKFLLSYAAKPFAEMAAKPEFEAAIDATLLHLRESSGYISDPQLAMAARWRDEGAIQFARTLAKIATPDTQPVVEQIGHLKGNV